MHPRSDTPRQTLPVEDLASRLEMICSGCDGDGILLDEAWQHWHAVRRDLTAALAEARGPIEAQLRREHLHAHDTTPPPGPAEYPCADCSNAGTVPTADGRELLAFLGRHWRP